MKTLAKILFCTLVISWLICVPTYAQNIPSDIKTKIENYEKSIENYHNEGNTQKELDLLNKTAFLCWNNQLYEKSINYFSKVLEINKKEQNQKGILLTTNYIGMVYEENQDYNSAIKYFNEAFLIYKKLNNKEDIASALANISQTYQLLEDYEKSNKAAKEGLEIAKEISSFKFQRTFYGILANNYQTLGNSEKSIEFFDLFASIDKYLKNKEIKTIKTESEAKVNQAQEEKQQTQIALNKQTDKLKVTENSLAQVEEVTREQKMELELKESKIKAQDAQLRVERLLRSFLIGVFIIFIIFFAILYNFYSKIKNQKIQIEKQRDILDLQNKNINASIQYAQRIQKAILPVKNQLEEIFENFILYKPKDVVSGDFYWFAKLNSTIFLAAVDCTGHGVPGAFMSMIGNSLLNEIVLEKKIKEPSKILSLLNKKIINALKQEETDNNDGMDVCLISINLENNEMIFSGAKRPLFMYNKQKNELEEIKGDRISIGGSVKEKNFNDHKIKTKSGDILYLSSDGLTDQNNINRKRFGSKKLKDTLINNIEKPMKDQMSIIESELNNFQANEEQRDDITLIGLKIN